MPAFGWGIRSHFFPLGFWVFVSGGGTKVISLSGDLAISCYCNQLLTVPCTFVGRHQLNSRAPSSSCTPTLVYES